MPLQKWAPATGAATREGLDLAKTDRSASTVPAHLENSARATRASECLQTRREFLATATSFGATAAAAYAMIGLPAPARAQGAAQMGGTVRIQQEIVTMRDPRKFDFNSLLKIGGQ